MPLVCAARRRRSPEGGTFAPYCYSVGPVPSLFTEQGYDATQVFDDNLMLNCKTCLLSISLLQESHGPNAGSCEKHVIAPFSFFHPL